MGYRTPCPVPAGPSTIFAMAKIVDHYRKVVTPDGLRAVAKHNAREGAYGADGNPTPGKWKKALTHPENRHLNEIHGTWAAVLASRRTRIREANLARAPQRNAAAAIEVAISASPDWFTGKSTASAKEYFAEARKWLAKEFGAEQILGWATHFDETTPHMHVLLVPLTKTKEVRVRKDGKDKSRTVEETKEWAYSSSRILGGPKGLVRLHDELAKALKSFGVERGVRGSEARHTDQRQWAAELKRREDRLLEGMDKTTAEAKRIMEYRDELIAWRDESAALLTAREQELVSLRETIQKDLAAYPDAALREKVGEVMRDLTQQERNAVWKAMEDTGASLRAARSPTRTKKQDRGQER